MAYTLPVIIIGGCWFAWRHRQNDDYIDYFAVSLRLIGALALILTSCGLAAINADDIWYFASGGVIGSLLSSALQPMLHSSGGTLALLCIWAAGLTLFTGWSWVSIAEKIGSFILTILTSPATVPVVTIRGLMKTNTKMKRKMTRLCSVASLVVRVFCAARWPVVSVLLRICQPAGS